VARSYGIHAALRWDGYDLARPSVFVIDAGGVIRYLYVGSSTFDRPDLKAVLDALAGVAHEAAAGPAPSAAGSPSGSPGSPRH
jgi:peroxiredoxin